MDPTTLTATTQTATQPTTAPTDVAGPAMPWLTWEIALLGGLAIFLGVILTLWALVRRANRAGSRDGPK